MRAANLVGEQFEWLTVVNREPSRNNHAMWKCVCRCGKEVVASTGDLRSGKVKSCGCRKKTFVQVTDETGNRYGRLTVLKRVGSDSDGKATWLCQCDCGNTVVAAGKNLRSGNVKSCGCYMRDVVSQRSLNDLTGMRFGQLTVIKRAATKYSARGNQSTQWLCRCDCGRECVVAAGALTTNNHTRSCGCMKSSFNEALIESILKEQQVLYKTQYSFSDLLSPRGYKLRFDFAFLNPDGSLICLLEYQGEQHFNVPAGNVGSHFGELQREVTDDLKRAYCKEHNIKLFEIRYDEDIRKSVQSIIEYTHMPIPCQA